MIKQLLHSKIVFIVILLCFLVSCTHSSHDIAIEIPPHSNMQYWYSQEEVLTDGTTLVIASTKDMPDTSVKLLSSTKETPGQYLTHGLSITFQVEEGTWHRIGIQASNDTDEPIIIHVIAKKITGYRLVSCYCLCWKCIHSLVYRISLLTSLCSFG